MSAVLEAPVAAPAAPRLADLRGRFREGKAALTRRFLESRPSATAATLLSEAGGNRTHRPLSAGRWF